MLRKALNMVPNGLLVIDVKSMGITFANAEMLAMLKIND